VRFGAWLRLRTRSRPCERDRIGGLWKKGGDDIANLRLWGYGGFSNSGREDEFHFHPEPYFFRFVLGEIEVLIFVGENRGHAKMNLRT